MTVSSNSLTSRDLFRFGSNAALWASYLVMKSVKEKENTPSKSSTALAVGALGLALLSNASRLSMLLRPQSAPIATIPLPPIDVPAFGKKIALAAAVDYSAQGVSLRVNGFDVSRAALICSQVFNVCIEGKNSLPPLIDAAIKRDTSGLSILKNSVRVFNLGTEVALLSLSMRK